MLQLLRHHADEDIARQLHTMSADYNGDDYVNRYLRPLNLWLRTEASKGQNNVSSASILLLSRDGTVWRWQHSVVAPYRCFLRR